MNWAAAFCLAMAVSLPWTAAKLAEIQQMAAAALQSLAQLWSWMVAKFQTTVPIKHPDKAAMVQGFMLPTMPMQVAAIHCLLLNLLPLKWTAAKLPGTRRLTTAAVFSPSRSKVRKLQSILTTAKFPEIKLRKAVAVQSQHSSALLSWISRAVR